MLKRSSSQATLFFPGNTDPYYSTRPIKLTTGDRNKGSIRISRAAGIIPAANVQPSRVASHILRHSMDILPDVLALSHSQRAIQRRRESKGSLKHPAKMRLISKTSPYGHLDQRSALGDLFAGEVKTPHKQIAVWTGSTHDPKLPGQIVAGKSGHCL